MLQPSNTAIRCAVFLAIVISSLFPPMVRIFESSMINHMLIQIPLLALSGALLLETDSYLYRSAEKFDSSGTIALILGTGWLLYWMLPMSLDFATIEPSNRILKVLTVPLGIGLCFRWVWIQSNAIVRIVILFESWAGIARLGWLYLESPDQLCSSYLIGEQQVVGKLLLIGAAITGFIGLNFGIFGRFQSVNKSTIDTHT